MVQLLAMCALSGFLHAADLIWDTNAGQGQTLEEFAARPREGDVYILGEQHAQPGNEKDAETIAHHANQVRMLQALTDVAQLRGFHVNTGMEFFTYTHQPLVDAYLAGQLPEPEFLQQISWGKAPFEFYREQVLLPTRSGGRTVALNIPRDISGQVAKAGPNSLSLDQRKYLPPLWERGRAEYFERFQEAMGGHVKDEALENYFWAQSLWDDTMAWNTVKAWAADPLAVHVIIVGEFHAEFGHGLAARLKRHGAPYVRTILQVPVKDFSEAEIKRATAPDSKYGARADYLWLYN